MSSSQALTRRTPPWIPPATDGAVMVQENSRPEGGKWALFLNAFLSPSPGRTLDQVYTAAGKVLETQANRIAYKLGLGPHVIAWKIKSYFGDAEQRSPPKLKKLCSKLVKYSLPTESANTQCQAFKEIVDLVTLFPGLREWMFWEKLAKTCLSDTTISAILERRSVSDSTTCSEEGLSVIESLLVGQNCAALCIQYLAGVLDLPRFWQNLGSAHSQVADKLCCRMVQVLKDIGVDIPTLGLIEEAPVDYDGVDLLATALLGGLSSWFRKLDRDDWAMQPWYETFTQVLQLLREPRAGELLPNSSASATSLFEDILPTTYQDWVLNVMVDNIVSDLEEENLGQSIESLDDSQSQTADLDSEEMPPAETTVAENSDSSEEDAVSDITGYEQQFGMASEHGDVLEDLINGTTGIPRISGTQSVLASTPYLSPEAQCKDLEGQKLILSNKQRHLGDNHPETLEAMENLAWLHHELGEYGSAMDLRVTFKEAQEVMELALEKQRKVLGENHPETARTLGSLALAYQGLGQLNKAQELAMSAVEKHSQLLGEDHPDTLWSICTLADIYRQLDQFTEAEDQYHTVVEKSINILGEHHPDTLRAMGGLGRIYLASGQLKKAEGLLTVVFDNGREQLGQLSAAEELAIVALEKHQKVRGENHPNTLWIMGELALIFQQQGQPECAEELLVTVLEKRRKISGDNHSYTRWTMNQLANT
ncbi:hypothetical protein B0H14DRAFT_3710244 [Mycena olivaceomarginata]|nr:hypothetical protein B0H14DRAFT_3710244 [Mycena olivaceomarginata]